MKKQNLIGIICLTTLLFGCQDEKDQNRSNMSEVLTSDAGAEEVVRSADGFAAGLATDGREYFTGLLASVIAVDVKFKEVDRLDDIDAEPTAIKNALDSTLIKITAGRNALMLYDDKDWPLRTEYQQLTLEWFSSLEGLINNHLYTLADQLSRPEIDTWTDEEWTAYENYLVDFNDYYEIDSRWVKFQQTFADSNGFTIGEPIDVDGIIEEAEIKIGEQ